MDHTDQLIVRECMPPLDTTVSYRMSRVRTQHTAPELLVRRYLFAAGFRYALHSAKLPGKPDLVLRKYGAVVFVHGCFWHGHGANCTRKNVRPKHNAAFWEAKFARNEARDHRDQLELRAMGWRVFVVWECELRKESRGATLHRLTKELLESTELDFG